MESHLMSFWNGSRWVDDRPVSPPRLSPSPRRRSLRDWLATIPIILLVPVLISPLVPVGASSASLTVAGVAVANGQLAVIGQSFPGRDWIQFTWDGSASSMPTVRATSDGQLSTTITIPSGTAPGDHVLGQPVPGPVRRLAGAATSIRRPSPIGFRTGLVSGGVVTRVSPLHRGHHPAEETLAAVTVSVTTEGSDPDSAPTASRDSRADPSRDSRADPGRDSRADPGRDSRADRGDPRRPRSRLPHQPRPRLPRRPAATPAPTPARDSAPTPAATPAPTPAATPRPTLSPLRPRS